MWSRSRSPGHAPLLRADAPDVGMIATALAAALLSVVALALAGYLPRTAATRAIARGVVRDPASARTRPSSGTRSPERPATRRAPADAARQARLAGRARRPTAAACPSSADAARRRTAGRGFLWFVLAPARAQLALGAALPALERRTARDGPVQPLLPRTGQGRPGHARSPPRATRSQGTFKRKLRYPQRLKTATPTKLFATQVPTFWNGSQLSALLEEKGVADQRRSRRRTSRRCSPSCCSASARRC